MALASVRAGRESDVAVTQDAPMTKDGRETAADQPWSLALVRTYAERPASAGKAPVVLEGVYQASDEATLAAAISGHILEDLRSRTPQGWPEEAQPDVPHVGVRVRITIEWLPPAGAD